MPSGHGVAAKLATCKALIIDEWEKRVRRYAPPARQLDRAQLRDSLPQVLDVMVDTLGAVDPKKTLFAKEKLLAAGHGRTRAQDAGYSLDRVIEEYHLLLQVIFEVLESNETRLDRADRDLILNLVSMSIRNAVTEFQAVQDEKKDAVQENLNQANAALHRALGQKSAETIIKDQLLKAIYERVEDYAIFSLDPHGFVTSWSDGCRKIKQYIAEEIVGLHYSTLYPPEGRVRGDPMKHLEMASQQGRFRGEGLRMRKNGELFLADVFITPMYEGSELVGFFKIVADLTERNKIMQEMDLTRAQVTSLRAESELRDRFIYTLSHDLRTPLATAHMSAELIALKGCDVQMHHKLAVRTARHIRRVDEMVTDLLDASAVKEGRPFPLKIEEADLVALANETCTELAQRIGDRFRIKAPTNLHGHWDGKALRRVIENLASNAVKYGDAQGDVTITIREAESRVIIRVHNFGSTISEKEQGLLFELFQRTDSARDSTNMGWGLGLTLVRGITEAHGGVVLMRSLPVEGTSFIVDLPRDARIASRQ